jgi:hypothetical protein
MRLLRLSPVRIHVLIVMLQLRTPQHRQPPLGDSRAADHQTVADT